VYLGVLTILVLVAISTVSSLWLVDHVNHEHQRQRLMGGILFLAADQVIADDLSLDNVKTILNAPLELTPFSESLLGRVEKARLYDQQYLICEEENGVIEVYVLINVKGQQFILKGLFNEFSTSHIRGSLSLIQSLVQRHDFNAQQFNRYAAKQILPVVVLQHAIPELPDKNQITVPNYEARYNVSKSEGRFYSYIPHLNSIVELGPVVFHQGLSVHSVLVVIALAVILSGIAVYWLVHRFELNLQHLERASTRIASGHLNSRVKVNNVDSFGRLGLAFNRMAEQIQRLMGVQKEMIRAVSHELRTPVARMRFGMQMLEDSTTDSYLQKQLQDMDKDLQELDELVDEILTYARLEEGGPILDFKEFNLLELIEKVVEETRRRTDQVEIEWQSDMQDADAIHSDIEYRYMHRALQNLVGNGCRYAKQKIMVSYHFKDDICRIDVEDDGDGIPEKDWDRVFSLFTRLDDSRTRTSGGYGLGLSIVRRIIYWHGGKALVGRSRWGGAKMSLIWPKNHQV
jgi:two-component system sensor histidine kinase RstB